MKFSKILSLLFCLCSFILLSCSQRASTKAFIFERKQIDGDQLMIKYKYLVDAKTYHDSTIIKNQVLKGDTIAISYNKNDPQNSSATVEK